MKDVIIIGGGLAGLLSAISLRKAGLNVVLFEKKKYPYHKVCGEYISTEVVNYFERLQLDLSPLTPVSISKLHFSSPDGTDIHLQLDMGAISVSRYSIDHFLFKKALELGVTCHDGLEVVSVSYKDDSFEILDETGQITKGRCCLGAYGRRSQLDRKLNRPFFEHRTGYVGVKRHYSGEYPMHQVGLHNFKGGYCGISNVENNRVNVCYMTESKYLKDAGDIKSFEKTILRSNRHIWHYLDNATPIFEEHIVVSQMYFGNKSQVENHMLMCGDAAGAITPLTGNGMAMAIHSSKICTELVLEFLTGKITRDQLEKQYERNWKSLFSNRIQLGNIFQPLFGKPLISDFSLKILKKSPKLLSWMINQTHGSSF